MSEVVISKKRSLLLATACLVLGGYCVQYSLVSQPLSFVWIYGMSLLLFIAMTLANFQGVRFTGLNVMPPNKILIVLFWSALVILGILYVMGVGGDVAVPKSRPAHFVVGLGLLVFFGLSFFGSFFSGFGMYLFLRNPILWVKDKKFK